MNPRFVAVWFVNWYGLFYSPLLRVSASPRELL